MLYNDPPPPGPWSQLGLLSPTVCILKLSPSLPHLSPNLYLSLCVQMESTSAPDVMSNTHPSSPPHHTHSTDNDPSLKPLLLASNTNSNNNNSASSSSSSLRSSSTVGSPAHSSNPYVAQLHLNMVHPPADRGAQHSEERERRRRRREEDSNQFVAEVKSKSSSSSASMSADKRKRRAPSTLV